MRASLDPDSQSDAYLSGNSDFKSVFYLKSPEWF